MVKKKILLIRLDKIGDLVCTLPVDEIEALKDFEVHWVISKGLGFVLDHSVLPKSYTELDRNHPHEARKKLCDLIDHYKPDIAVSFYGPWWVSYCLWIKKVPLRVGALSQWASFLFLNKKLRQRRSEAIKHEADYNFELINFALNQKTDLSTPILKLKSHSQSNILTQFNITSKSFFVVHPGMAGSALNWSSHHYVGLIDEILNRSETDDVVITGTPVDDPWIQPLRDRFENHRRVIFLQNKLSSTDLITILTASKGVVAPSTGVLHLAASLGIRTVGIYSPIQVHQKIRWGARGDQVKLLEPDVKCPEKFYCRREKCPFFYCMDTIKVTDVYRLLTEI